LRSQRACGFAYIVLAGISKRLAAPRFMKELVVGVAAPNDLTKSIIVEILYCGEGRDIEQVARTSK